MSILREDSLSSSGFDEANCCVVSCHMERAVHLEGKGSLPPTNKTLRPSVWQSTKESNATNSHVNLEMDSAPGKYQVKSQPHQHLDCSY